MSGTMTKSKRGRIYEGMVETCCHQVEYWYEIPRRYRVTPEFKVRLEDAAEERAKECIIEGYNSGELNYCDGDCEIRGWWNIKTD